ncbi:MAG: hypothetical protein DDT34_02139 [Firmicutes bacterium]|nr:hypothetical protein [Bacillota bacterium]
MGFDYTRFASGSFELPDSWQVAAVQDVAVVNEQSICRSYEHQLIEYIDTASVQKGKIKSNSDSSTQESPEPSTSHCAR